MVLLDTHVHIYQCFDLQKFFDSAYKNFVTAADKIQPGGSFSAVMVLTDWSGKNWFKKVSELISLPDSERSRLLGPWNWKHTSEKTSFYFEDSDRNKIFIIAGKKIITAENLEVLAFGLDNSDFKNDLSLIETVSAILQNKSVPLVPWAVGKWLGSRGGVLTQLINEVDPQRYFLCDNGNRPFFWSKPHHFTLFKDKGGRLLSGSDPLHFPSEMGRAGRVGCWIEGDIDREHPTRWLMSILDDVSTDIQLYGPPETALRFFRNQIAMQLLKKKWKNAYYRE